MSDYGNIYDCPDHKEEEMDSCHYCSHTQGFNDAIEAMVERNHKFYPCCCIAFEDKPCLRCREDSDIRALTPPEDTDGNT